MIFADIVVATVIALLIFACLVLASRSSEDIMHMSDDEYMENLPPGTSRDVALRVRVIVAKHAGVPPENIRPDTKFFQL